MAAEASRSSGSVDSYIGSLISLTSKSEIRYEGVLFTINTEEASIGLRNVQSFGTEGRKKDGPQVPPIDKVYEYIVFRGSDIKDLQVKSSPPPQTAFIHNDPAIIQSHYSQAPTSTSMQHASNTAVLDVTAPKSQISQRALLVSPFQSSLPLHQPGGNISSWSSSAIPSSSGPVMPTYHPAFYGASSNLQSQQHVLQQPPRFSMPAPDQQPNASMQATMPMSQPMLLHPPSIGGSSAPPSMIPVQSVSAPADTSMSTLSNTRAHVPLQVSQSLGLPLLSPVSNALDLKGVSTVTNQIKPYSSSMASYNGMTESVSTAVESSISPALVTPGQFVQPRPALFPVTQPTKTLHNDVEAVQVPSASPVLQPSPVQLKPPVVSAPSPESVSAVLPKPTESQTPLLPLPSGNQEFDRGPMYNHYNHRGRRGRGRGSELSNSATRFTEDFDFEAMNEKFNKDEVWGHLGKANKDDNEDSQYSNSVEFPPFEAKPVYNKDDFFDSLSSNSQNGSRNHGGRPRYSEQRRFDTETFDGAPVYRGGGRGGRGPGYGRFHRGGYYGRGYDHSGRGRGQYNVYRVT